MERRCECCLETYYFGSRKLCVRCKSLYYKLAKQKIIKVGDYTMMEFIKNIHKPNKKI